MAKIILHKPGTTREDIENLRRERILRMTPGERMSHAFYLMELALKFKNGPIKLPQGKGVVLKKKGL